MLIECIIQPRGVLGIAKRAGTYLFVGCWMVGWKVERFSPRNLDARSLEIAVSLVSPTTEDRSRTIVATAPRPSGSGRLKIPSKEVVRYLTVRIHGSTSKGQSRVVVAAVVMNAVWYWALQRCKDLTPAANKRSWPKEIRLPYSSETRSPRRT